MGERPSLSASTADYDFIEFKGVCKQVCTLVCADAFTGTYAAAQCVRTCVYKEAISGAE